MKRNVDHSEFQSYMFGKRPVQELIKLRPRSVLELLVVEQNAPEARLGDFKGYAGDIRFLAEDDFLKATKPAPGLHHQGIAARFRPQESVSFDSLLHAVSRHAHPILLALDEVQDPHNVGAVFRVAETLGAPGLCITERRSAPINDTVRRISTGATEFVPFSRVTNLARAIGQAKEKGFWIYGTTLSEESLPLPDVRFHAPTMLIVGSEHKGIRQQTAELCDQLLHIPQQGVIGSMNVSTATSVVLYEAIQAIRKPSQ